MDMFYLNFVAVFIALILLTIFAWFVSVGAKIVIPFGDKGACLKRAKLINRSAELEYVRNTHNLCMGSAQSFKAANMFLKDDYYEAYPDMRVCRAIFVMAGVSYAQP